MCQFLLIPVAKPYIWHQGKSKHSSHRTLFCWLIPPARDPCPVTWLLGWQPSPCFELSPLCLSTDSVVCLTLLMPLIWVNGMSERLDCSGKHRTNGPLKTLARCLPPSPLPPPLTCPSTRGLPDQVDAYSGVVFTHSFCCLLLGCRCALRQYCCLWRVDYCPDVV